ncbi:MAG: peptidase S8 [Desulfobulbaceae bacterium]|nr:MAG: peptidase S8 [Desulfobulbaceae bacterium]
MKPHLIVKTHEPVAAMAKVPYWGEAIGAPDQLPSLFMPALDKILAHYRLPLRMSHEYPRARPAQPWSPGEIRQGLNRIYRFILQGKGTIPDKMVRQIRLLPEVRYVRLGDIAVTDLPRSHSIARDDYTEQQSRSTDRQSRQAIGLDQAHLMTKGSSRVTVAVLDTGVDLNHGELRHAYRPGRDFVNIIDGADRFLGDFLGYDSEPADRYVGHGTHVAGIIAGRGRAMPQGVAPSCRILPVRVLGAMRRGDNTVGAGLIDNINVGLKWAIDAGADIINMSLGVRSPGGGLPYKELIDYARDKNVTIVAASGNNGSEDLYYPGAYPYVITVGALSRDQYQVAPFSTYGNQVDIVAPGSEIYSSFLDNSYAFSSGTSQAAPFVAGAVALLKSYALKQGAALDDNKIKYLLKHTSDKMGRPYKDVKGGYGKLNIADALQLLKSKFNRRG